MTSTQKCARRSNLSAGAWSNVRVFLPSIKRLQDYFTKTGLVTGQGCIASQHQHQCIKIYLVHSAHRPLRLAPPNLLSNIHSPPPSQTKPHSYPTDPRIQALSSRVSSTTSMHIAGLGEPRQQHLAPHSRLQGVVDDQVNVR